MVVDFCPTGGPIIVVDYIDYFILYIPITKKNYVRQGVPWRELFFLFQNRTTAKNGQEKDGRAGRKQDDMQRQALLSIYDYTFLI